MKRLMVLVGLAVMVIAFTLAASKAPRRGLVVNEFEGKVIVNTHPQQPMELNPWEQPRLKIQMEWLKGDKKTVMVVLSFLSMAKKNKLCAGAVTVKGVDWVWLAGYEYKVTKSGVWEDASISIRAEELFQLAFVKMPLKFRVCGNEFYLHKYEGEDLRQAVEIWRSW